MTDEDPRLRAAIERHRAGDLSAAAAAYAAILAADPRSADALHLLGIVRQQSGAIDESIALIRQALTIRPDAAFASNLANAYLAQRRYQEAADACRVALKLNAAFGMAHTNLGVALHGLGRRVEAVESLRIAIAIDPARPEAQASLGVVLLELGRRDEAMAVLRGLLAAHPSYAPAHYNLANALAQPDTLAVLAEALPHYDSAIALHPGYAEAHANRGGVLRRLGRLDEAEVAYQRALELAPGSALTHHNLGLLFGDQGKPAQALEAHERALSLEPDLAVAHSHRGNVLTALERDDEAMIAHDRALALSADDPLLLHNLGLTLAHQARFREAAAAQSRAIAARPDYAEAHACLGACLAEMGQTDAALYSARKAVELEPDLGVAHSALGQAQLEVDDLDGALTALTLAVTLRPSLAQGHLNLGVLHFRRGDLDAAEAAFETALALRPDTWEARYNRGVARLKRGDYANGWEDFEQRLRAPERRRREAHYPQPLWRGEDLSGQTILLHGEQGLGDMLQCLRFIPGVAALGARVVVEAPTTLRRLVEAMPAVSAFVGMGQASQADYRLPLFSLPHRLGFTLESLPETAPYLRAPDDVAKTWRDRLVERTGELSGPPRVGVVWSGNVTSRVDRGRSIPLAAFAPLAAAVGAPLISLQKQFGLDELRTLPAGMEVFTLGQVYDAGDLADTAAVIEALDLVVCCDTAVAHLAGAVGKPTWLAINAVADWRWLTERSDSPWYPAMRLYRQPTLGDWDGVFKAMALDWIASRPDPNALGADPQAS